jgi:hypothetical protein
MACVVKRPDSGFWIACFTDIHGRGLKAVHQNSGKRTGAKAG